MSTTAYYTEEGLKKLVDELNQLKTTERKRISQQIAEARDKGDLSENAEYDAAKDAQGLLEARIAKLEEVVANARVVDPSQLDDSRVFIHSKVTVRMVDNDSHREFILVAESEADIRLNKISVNSPIGQGLLGKSRGEIAEVSTPSGTTMRLEVIEISR
ncbi:MAG: transcription elongation factor GreA [Flavobacteriales bacterium]|nr:transcription elongation factor GreA [Flavobacteriales bacterium]